MSDLSNRLRWCRQARWLPIPLQILVALMPCAIGAQEPASIGPTERARIDSVFVDEDKPKVPGCALGVFIDDRVAYARGYGLADLERNVPITTASAFDIGSTLKQFTAATIALLVQDGKLSFGDDVRKYIPELPIYGAPITIDNLMHHTSGLRDYVGLVVLAGHSLEEATTDSQALALVVHQRHSNFPTGSRYEYSNTGYFLLSVIVQRVTGKPLADVERERIFEPLGMMETRVRNHFAMLIPNRALGYGPDGHGGFQNSMSNWSRPETALSSSQSTMRSRGTRTSTTHTLAGSRWSTHCRGVGRSSMATCSRTRADWRWITIAAFAACSTGATGLATMRHSIAFPINTRRS